jgi:hypothetical protein
VYYYYYGISKFHLDLVITNGFEAP